MLLVACSSPPRKQGYRDICGSQHTVWAHTADRVALLLFPCSSCVSSCVCEPEKDGSSAMSLCCHLGSSQFHKPVLESLPGHTTNQHTCSFRSPPPPQMIKNDGGAGKFTESTPPMLGIWHTLLKVGGWSVGVSPPARPMLLSVFSACALGRAHFPWSLTCPRNRFCVVCLVAAWFFLRCIRHPDGGGL